MCISFQITLYVFFSSNRLLDRIFHGLFDESPEVRSILSTVINFWLKSSINQTNSLHCIHANTHLITLHKLLKQIVPLLLLNENNNNKDKNINSNNTHNKIHSSDNLTFNESTHWLCNNWLTIMKSMNYLMINEYESSQRYVNSLFLLIYINSIHVGC